MYLLLIAACMLFPVGVIMYTSVGGIKATFLMDYAHTIILYIIIVIFAMNVYGVNPLIGSIDKMFDLLQTASELQPVPDNAKGSYLTMASVDGIIFGVINIVGNFGTVFVDNAYWQRAIGKLISIMVT
jgi:Na+/proline symporter